MTKCPTCGESVTFRRAPRTEYSPVAPVIFGGFLLAWIFALSRKSRFHCGGCNGFFLAHTIASRIWLGIFGLLIICILLPILGVIYDVSTQ